MIKTDQIFELFFDKIVPHANDNSDIFISFYSSCHFVLCNVVEGLKNVKIIQGINVPMVQKFRPCALLASPLLERLK